MLVNDHAVGQPGLNLIQQAVQISGQFQCVGHGLFLNADNDCGFPIVGTGAALRRGPDHDLGHIAD